MKRLGLVVNPLAGIGGRVGLKGSDGAAAVRRALALGAVPEAARRTVLALQALDKPAEGVELLTYPAGMGADAALQAGWAATVVGHLPAGLTSGEDTVRAVRELCALGVDLLLFAGGDGTARDVCTALGAATGGGAASCTLPPVLGIPAGVKIHSAVYATRPENAGRLAGLYLAGQARLQEAEVLDLDEDQYRQGQISARLYGFLTIPYRPRLVQNQKVPSPASEARQAAAIAAQVIERMQPGRRYVLGPGTTTRAIAAGLGLPKTLVGVDVVQDGGLVAADANQAGLLALLAQAGCRPSALSIVVAPIGGQGFLFGRGNQQIGPAVLQYVAREDIWVVCTPDKLNALAGRPFLLDTGDLALDQRLSGYYRVITGYRQQTIYPAAAG